MILMLEDDRERIDRFVATARALAEPPHLFIWNNAHTMIAGVDRHLSSAELISLDHDLIPVDGDLINDPGDGMDVVRYLVKKPPACPVIVHSSNRERSDWMLGELELAGWDYHRIAPLGDDWIEVDWYRLVRRLLRKARR